MPMTPNPVRAQAEEFLRLEIARVGVAGLDKRAIVKRFVAAGASRTRAASWVADMVAEAERLGPFMPTAAEKAGHRAEAVASAAAADAQREEQLAAAEASAVQEVLPSARDMDMLSAKAAAVVDTGQITLAPDSTGPVLEHIQTIMAVCTRVLEHSHGPDGKVRNTRTALQSVETLRRTLETALKLYEAINNVRLVERFMAEMIDAVRPLEPDVAARVIDRMRVVQSRWAT